MEQYLDMEADQEVMPQGGWLLGSYFRLSCPEEKIIHSNLERHKPTEINKPILLNGT